MNDSISFDALEEWALGLDLIPYTRLCRIQEALSKKAVLSDEWLGNIRKVAGVDASYKGALASVGFSVFDLSENKITLISVSKSYVNMPYIPSLLCFREGPVILRILRKLTKEYDLLLVNGHGLAHPRRCGLATYVGIILNKPVIGISKKPLGKLEADYNATSLKMFGDKFYYSVGNMMTLEGAQSILRRITPNDSKLPIPLGVAHRFSTKMLRAE